MFLWSRARTRRRRMTMSHSVTIRTHTVTSSSTAILVNTGYLKTWGGILKLLELALGIVCVGIIGNQLADYNYRIAAYPFFLLITTTFMIGTFIILLSCLTSLSTSTILAKTIYELMYHAIAFGLILAAALTLLVEVSKKGRSYELEMGAAVCGLVNSAFYFISTIFALRTYRGI